MKIFWALGFFVMLTSGNSYSQVRDTILLVPEGKFLQTDHLTDYNGKYDFIRIKDGTETIIGGLEDNFFISGKGKEKQGLRICNIIFGTNSILDSGLCNLSGLKPIYHKSIQTTKTLNLNFSDKKISGEIQLKDSSKKEIINFATSVSLFDSYYEDIIAKSLKLRKGIFFKFPEYIYERGGIVWSLGEILGNENKFTESGFKVVEWTIKFYETNNKSEIVRTTIYKINEKNREILLREYITSNGRVLMRKKLI